VAIRNFSFRHLRLDSPGSRGRRNPR